jgi:hypothetical protein
MLIKRYIATKWYVKIFLTGREDRLSGRGNPVLLSPAIPLKEKRGNLIY